MAGQFFHSLEFSALFGREGGASFSIKVIIVDAAWKELVAAFYSSAKTFPCMQFRLFQIKSQRIEV